MLHQILGQDHRLDEVIQRVEDNLLNTSPLWRTSVRLVTRSWWTEDDSKYFDSIDVPGIPKENLKVAVQNGFVTVVGSHGDRNYDLVISIPEDADSSNVKASLRDGVLYLEEKKQKSTAKSIEVKVE